MRHFLLKNNLKRLKPSHTWRGITGIKTLKTKLGPVGIESGMIAIGDPTLGDTVEYETKKLISLMEQHKFYAINTEGDGTLDVTVRLVDIEEPLLGPKEYRFIISNSAPSIIKVVSGKIKCSDLYDLPNDEIKGVGYDIENGYYKVIFYLKEIRDKYFGYVVVLSKIPLW